MISFIISPIERSLPHNLISPPMTLPLCLLPKKSLMRKSLRWKGGKGDKKERRLRGSGLRGRMKMMLRLVGNGQHKLMRKRLRKVAM